MKNIFSFTFFCLIVLASTVFSQVIPKVSISGKITDKATNKPIENVDVFLSFTTRGDITDKDGNFTIKNIPASLYKSLKENARIHHRSINGEAIVCIERSLGISRVRPDKIIDKIVSLRNQLRIPKLTERLLREAKEKGRP